MLTCVSFVLLLGWTQSTGRGVAAVEPESEIAMLARGWTSLAAGRAADAERIADRLLVRDPSSHHAIGLKLQAQVSMGAGKALDSYERWLGGRRDEDVALLAIVAEGVLRELMASGDASIRAEARRQLTSRRPAAATLDAADLQRLQKSAQDPATGDKTSIADALTAGGAQAVPSLIDLMEKSRGPNRAAAARALGRIGDARAEAGLLQAFGDEDPFVRASAAVALARLGSETGRGYINTMLVSDLPDLRLMAADAWDGKPGPWVEAVTPLLDNEHALVRIRAAAAIAPVDPAAARRVLSAALSDGNPAVRAETARTLTRLAGERPGVADPAALRKLLREADPWIRLSAASSLRAANTPQP
jgi:HEAT repeat protein